VGSFIGLMGVSVLGSAWPGIIFACWISFSRITYTIDSIVAIRKGASASIPDV
jgi:hypothetical protein